MADAKVSSEPASRLIGSASGISRKVFSAWASGTRGDTESDAGCPKGGARGKRFGCEHGCGK